MPQGGILIDSVFMHTHSSGITFMKGYCNITFILPKMSKCWARLISQLITFLSLSLIDSYIYQ